MVIFNDIDDEPDGGEASSSVALARLAAADVAAPTAPELPVDALQRLPELEAGGGDPYWRLATAFLVGYPPHSSRAYFGDLKAWYAWCANAGVHPLRARRHHVDYAYLFVDGVHTGP